MAVTEQRRGAELRKREEERERENIDRKDRKRKQKQNEKDITIPHLLHCGELTGGRDGAEEGGGAAGLLL